MKTHILLAGASLAAMVPARTFSALTFDATTVQPDTGFEPMPPGWYNAAIDESEVKPTNAGDGTYIKLRFNILDGQYAGRKVFTQINLQNPNPQAQEIGQRQLSAVCHAVNVLKPTATEQLHSIPLKIKLKFVPASGQYSEKNEIVSYKKQSDEVDMAGGDSAGAAAFGAGAPTPPPVKSEGQPWTTGAAAELAGAPAPKSEEQPWSPPSTPAAPPAPPAADTPPPPPAVHDPLVAAVADGWAPHPTAPGYHYKGQEVKKDDEVASMYPAAPTAEAPAAPPAPPTAPNADAASGAQSAPPPWQQN